MSIESPIIIDPDISSPEQADETKMKTKYLELLNTSASDEQYFEFFLDLMYADTDNTNEMIDVMNEYPNAQYDFCSALEVTSDANTKLQSKESLPQNVFERVTKTFFWIAAKQYYSPDELKSFFSSIEVRNGDGKNTAKIESNHLVLFDTVFDQTDGKQNYNDEELEYYVLHEIGHIIDYSKVLEGDYEPEFANEDYESEMTRIVSEIPLNLQDVYSKSMGELGYHEAIAHLTAVWSKHRNDFDGFFLDRMLRTNEEALVRIFGTEENLKAMYFECKDNENPILAMRRFVQDENIFNALFENSHQIFNYLNTGWAQGKLSLGSEFYDRLANIEGEENEGLFGSGVSLALEPDKTADSTDQQALGYSGGNLTAGRSNSTNKKGVSPQPAGGRESESAASEVVAASIDLLKASSDELNPFQ